MAVHSHGPDSHSGRDLYHVVGSYIRAGHGAKHAALTPTGLSSGMVRDSQARTYAGVDRAVYQGKT
ncbi:MAG: hypothetical protein WC479_08255 [Candidatus Izemoplasmatales bacterium]